MSNQSAKGTSESNPGRGFFWREAGVLLLFWLLMSGKFEVVHIGFGLIAVGIVLWFDRRLPGSATEKADQSLLAHFHRFPVYIPWLALQMIKATWQVATIVLSRRIHIDPCLVEFRSDQPHSVATVTLGNSITLTPGTLTLQISDDHFRVHALTEANADELLAGEISLHVGRLFGVPTGGVVREGRKSREYPEE